MVSIQKWYKKKKKLTRVMSCRKQDPKLYIHKTIINLLGKNPHSCIEGSKMIQ